VNDPGLAASTPTTAARYSPVERGDVLSNRVAQVLIQRVLDGELRPGQQLPSEQDLCDQFGVSRTVIREAIRSLAGRGVIDVRSGRKARVGLVGRGHVVESMQLFIRGLQVTPDDLPYSKVHEVRQMIELTMVELAAERARKPDLERLRRTFDDMRHATADVAALSHHDVEFHRLIADMTGNELFGIMLDSIGGVLTEIRALPRS
jgi:DNA-binding FadR family transcriptional regulator